MSVNTVRFTSGEHILVGNLRESLENKKQTGILILHGGGTSTKERHTIFQEYWAEKGYTSLAFDFQGVGESEGVFAEGTLLRRREDAQVAYHFLKQYTDTIVVIAFSMGGHIAARLSEVEKLDALVLICPAAYAKEAEEALLNEAFTTILRTPNSWRNSPAFSAIKNFTGKALILYGEHESVIPPQVQQLYKEAVGTKGKFIVVSHGTHALLIPQNPAEERAKEEAYREMTSFLL